jgi:hypothetical protein
MLCKKFQKALHMHSLAGEKLTGTQEIVKLEILSKDKSHAAQNNEIYKR